MPTAPVDNKGNYVYYEDSGAPEGAQDYVTVVIVHGSLINSGMSPYNSTMPTNI